VPFAGDVKPQASMYLFFFCASSTLSDHLPRSISVPGRLNWPKYLVVRLMSMAYCCISRDWRPILPDATRNTVDLGTLPQCLLCLQMIKDMRLNLIPQKKKRQISRSCGFQLRTNTSLWVSKNRSSLYGNAHHITQFEENHDELQLTNNFAIFRLEPKLPGRDSRFPQIFENPDLRYVLFLDGIDESQINPNLDWARHLPAEVPITRKEHDRYIYDFHNTIILLRSRRQIARSALQIFHLLVSSDRTCTIPTRYVSVTLDIAIASSPENAALQSNAAQRAGCTCHGIFGRYAT
jgi:hypothetical protein